MPEHALDELKELAKPALRHAELINLARVETPSKADEMASIRWPRRQAKATRFLAMLRRDYGNGAFEALVLPAEHARPDGTEHAQGGSVMVALDSLYPVGIRNVAFKPRARDTKDLTVWFFTSGETKEVSFDEEVTRLKLNPEQQGLLVRRIVDAMLAQWANPKVQPHCSHSGSWTSALLAVREYIAEDREYYKKVLSATVIYHGGCSKDPVSLAMAVVPEALSGIEQSDEDRNRLSGLLPAKALQLVLDHLVESDLTEEEIRTMWRKMLMARYKENFVTSCIVEWWYGLKLNGKHFYGDVAEKTSQLCLIRDLSDLLFNNNCDTLQPGRMHLTIVYESWLELLDRVALACSHEWCHSKETLGIVENILVRGLARGQAAKVSTILARLGRNFGFCSFESTLVERKRFEDSLHRLMRGAIEQAVEDRNLGVACALTEYLGDTTQADELREKARHLKQRIALDFTFYTRADR